MIGIGTAIFLILLVLWVLFIHKWLARTVFARHAANPSRLRLLSTLTFVLALAVALLVAGVSLLSYLSALFGADGLQAR